MNQADNYVNMASHTAQGLFENLQSGVSARKLTYTVYVYDISLMWVCSHEKTPRQPKKGLKIKFAHNSLEQRR